MTNNIEIDKILEDELGKRTRELTAIRATVDSILSDNSSSYYKNIQVKMAFVLLYSHWEAYIWNASVHYMDYIHQNCRFIDDLSQELQRALFKIYMDQTYINPPTKNNHRPGSPGELLTDFSKKSVFSEIQNFKDSRIGGKSKHHYDKIIPPMNMSFDSFTKIKKNLGLRDVFDEELEKNAKKGLNETHDQILAKHRVNLENLLENRNSIAHGSTINIFEVSKDPGETKEEIEKKIESKIKSSVDEYGECHDSIVLFLTTYKDAIINSCDNSLYKKQS